MAISRRRALELLGIGAVAAAGCSSSLTEPERLSKAAPLERSFPLFPGSLAGPCDVQNVSDPSVRNIAFLAVAQGGWGFDFLTRDVTQSFVAVERAVLSGVINIDVSFPASQCSGACVVPSIPTGLFGIRSANQQNSQSITEGVSLLIPAVNVYCEGPTHGSTDYVILFEAGGPVRERYALLFPSRQTLVASDGAQRLSAYHVDIDPASACFSSFTTDQSIGAAQVLIRTWPQLGGVFRSGESVAVTPINVSAICTEDNCTEERSLFTLCFGQPAVAFYDSFF